MEDTLIKDPSFALPGRKALIKSDTSYEVILVDATETAVEQPKKRKNSTIQGKKHTIKSQVVVDKKTQQVICTAFTKGRRHDFRLFTESKTYMHPHIHCIADTMVPHTYC